MSLVKWAFTALLLLPAAEIAVFVGVALAIGWFWAVCLFLATTVLGVLLLRRSGRNDIERFRAALAADGLRALHLESPGFAPMAGGILLVFPGFITDVLGALLFVPVIRRRLAAMIGRARAARRRRRNPSVVDLTPEEWHQVSNKPLDDGRPRTHLR
jgi:UPF0716 protein FxsA